MNPREIVYEGHTYTMCSAEGCPEWGILFVCNGCGGEICETHIAAARLDPNPRFAHLFGAAMKINRLCSTCAPKGFRK